MRTCAHCHVEKPLSDYYKSVQWVCKICHVARGKARHKENPWRTRESNWKNKYGIILDRKQYEQMYESQAGLCRVCGRDEASGKLLAVDHNHDTGEIRGLLCTKCNTTLGWLEQYRQEFSTYLKGSEKELWL